MIEKGGNVNKGNNKNINKRKEKKCENPCAMLDDGSEESELMLEE